MKAKSPRSISRLFCLKTLGTPRRASGGIWESLPFPRWKSSSSTQKPMLSLPHSNWELSHLTSLLHPESPDISLSPKCTNSITTVILRLLFYELTLLSWFMLALYKRSISKVQRHLYLQALPSIFSMVFGNTCSVISLYTASCIEGRDPFSTNFVFATLTRISKNSYLHKDRSAFSYKSISSTLVAMKILSMVLIGKFLSTILHYIYLIILPKK